MSISGKRCAVSVSAVAVLLLAGCSRTSSAPTAAANPAGGPSAQTVAAPQVVPAKEAFWPMYKEAHSWAGDAEVMRVTAKVLPGFRNEAGKAGMWEAVFASPSLHKYRIYTYSIATAPPDVYKGVVAGLEMAWGGPTRDTIPGGSFIVQRRLRCCLLCRSRPGGGLAEEESGQGNRSGGDRGHL